MVTLIEAYEAKTFLIKTIDPIESIKFRMEQEGLKPADVSEIFGGPNRASEILNKKRELNMNVAGKLYQQLMVPAEALLA